MDFWDSQETFYKDTNYLSQHGWTDRTLLGADISAPHTALNRHCREKAAPFPCQRKGKAKSTCNNNSRRSPVSSFSQCKCKSECFTQLKEMAPATHPVFTHTVPRPSRFSTLQGGSRTLMELQGCPGHAKTLQSGPKTKGRVLWTFTEHTTGVSWVLRAGLTPAALHPHCLVSAKNIHHLAPARASKTLTQLFLVCFLRVPTSTAGNTSLMFQGTTQQHPHPKVTVNRTRLYRAIFTFLHPHDLPHTTEPDTESTRDETQDSQLSATGHRVNSSLSSLRFKLSNEKYCEFDGKCWSVLKEMIAYKERFLC